MKAIHVAAIAAVTAALTTILLVPHYLGAEVAFKRLPKPTIVEQLPYLSSAQDAWLHRLELCESGGNHLAINKVDRDGTPSYGAFQFKPSTLDFYAEKYLVATVDAQNHPDQVMDYSVQLRTVKAMILHRGEINWHQQFPDCVKRLGLPPAK